ncbi:MAG: hypothetical protein HY401_03035 [Elusimicrobia bacterium]|nr:hypothetical protein [Elusimicrobiota bacterium]
MNLKIKLIAGVFLFLSPVLRADQSDRMASQLRPVFEQGQANGSPIESSYDVSPAGGQRPVAANPAAVVSYSNEAGLRAPVPSRKPGKILAHADKIALFDFNDGRWAAAVLLGLLAGGIGAGAGALLAGSKAAIAGGVGGFTGIAGLPYLVAPAVLSAIAGGLIMNSWKGALMGGVPSLLAGLAVYAIALTYGYGGE